CKTKIHWRYPLVEIATALLSALVAWKFGYGWSALSALVLTWCLISAAVIDVDHQLLPDNITLPLLWLGLILSLTPCSTGVCVQEAVLGSAIGCLSLWSVYMVVNRLTGCESMGFGYVKLLAGLGAWLGRQQMLTDIILSSLSGSLIGIALMIFAGRVK